MKYSTIEEYLDSNKRHKEIKECFVEYGIGETAKRYGLTKSRIYQIVNTYDRRKRAIESREFVGLPNRIYLALKRAGINNENDLNIVYSEKGIDGITDIRGIGKESAEFILKYIGD